jgi:hypothetical protein
METPNTPTSADPSEIALEQSEALLACLTDQIDLPLVMRGRVRVYRIRRKGKPTVYRVNSHGRLIAEVIVERPYRVTEIRAIEGLRAGASKLEQTAIKRANDLIYERLKNQKRRK